MLTIGTSKPLSLKDLGLWIWGNERGYGPIVDIGNNGTSTAATFKFALKSPTTPAVVIPFTGAAAVPPDGMSVICSGEVFTSSELQKIAVCR